MSNPYQNSEKAEDSTRNLLTQNQVFQANNQTGQQKPIEPQTQSLPQVLPSQNPHPVQYVQPQPYQQPQQPQFVQRQGYNPPQLYPQPQPYLQQGPNQNIPPNFQQGLPQQRIPQQGVPQQGIPQYQQNPTGIGAVGVGLTCPVCFYTGPNAFQQVNGTQVWIWMVVLLFCCFFLFWIPLVCDQCKDTKVLCARCGYCLRRQRQC